MESDQGTAVLEPASASADSVKAMPTSKDTLDSLLSRINEFAKAGGEGASPNAIPSVPSDKPEVNSKPKESMGDWYPSEPTSLSDAKLSDTLVEEFILKALNARAEASGREISEQIKVPFRIVDSIMHSLKKDQMVAHKAAAMMNDYVYTLTEKGRERARKANAQCSYCGSAPVELPVYIDSVKKQSLAGQHPTQDDLKRAFSDLLINQKMLERLGPAINSGRGMFLFGAPGNGKTSIAERVTQSFGKYIWIPRAISIDGDIMRLFDPSMHVEVPVAASEGLINDERYDARWVRIERPTIVVGGELTMEALEVTHNSVTNVSEAPVQLKSNCGTLVIDDFGRQRMTTDELLNRWIVPLEKRYDFLNMNSGKKLQVPFDQLIVFSTNLEPKDLVDDAFLRRIPYKIEVTDPDEESFRKLMEIMAGILKVDYNADAVEYLIQNHYKAVDRPFRCCQPRDLILQIRNYCLYVEKPIVMSKENFDFAVDNYFAVM